MPPLFVQYALVEKGYSLEELWALARQYSPVLRQRRDMIDSARGGAIQQGLYPNPMMNTAWDTVGTPGPGKITAYFSQEIVTARKKQYDRIVAGFDVRIAKEDYSLESLRLYNDIRIAYYEVLHAQLNIGIQQYGETISNDLMKAALEMQKAGKVKSVDVLQFTATRNEQTVLLRQAGNTRDGAWTRLVTLLGDPKLPEQGVRGTLLAEPQKHDWESAWALVSQTSPELALARLRVEQAHAYLLRQQAGRIPNVTAGASIGRDITAETNPPYVNLAVPIQLYDRNQGNIAKARADLAVAHREIDRITLLLERKLADVFREYRNARELIEEYEKSVVQLTYEALLETDASYQKGETTYLELFHQRQQIMGVLDRYVTALKNEAVAAALIDGLLLQGE